MKRFRRGGFDRVGDGDDAGRFAVDGEEDRGGAVLAQAFGILGERRRIDVELGEEFRAAEREPLALDHADDALAGRRIEAAHGRKLDLALGGGGDNGRRQRMLAAAFDARRVSQHLSFVEAGQRHDRDDLRLAFGERAGLVDHQRVDLFHALERLGVLDQHAQLRAAADADHDRHRRGQTERAGAGDDQHAHRGHQPEGEARLRPERRPGREGDERHRDHRRHEPCGDAIGQPLDRRAAPLRGRHHLHDLRQQRVAADFVGAHHEAAAAIDGAADHARIFFLGHRHGFAGHHGFVERGMAVEHRAVDRHLVAGPHTQSVADRDGVERDFLVAAVVLDAARGLGREIEQARIAPEVAARARSSSTWPISTSTVIMLAASK